MNEMHNKNNEQDPISLTDRLLQYASEHPFTTLFSVALIVGGMIGLFHYGRLGYLPEIDAQAAATIFIALALTGTLLTILLACVFILPAFYLRMTLVEEARQADMPPAAREDGAQSARSAAVMLQTGLLAVGLWCLTAWTYFKDSSEPLPPWLWMTGIACMLAASPAIGVVARLVRYLQESFRQRMSRASLGHAMQYVNFSMASLVWFFALGLIGLLLILPIFSNGSLSTWDKIFWTLAFFAVVIVSNIVVAIPATAENRRYAPLIFLFFAGAPVALFMALPNPSFSIEQTTFTRLGLGSMRDSVFLVKPEACEALNLIRDNTCTPAIAKARDQSRENAKSFGCVRPDLLENRLGAEFLLAYKQPQQDTGKNRKARNDLLIPLKKDEVVLWAIGQDARSGELPCAGKTEGAVVPAT